LLPRAVQADRQEQRRFQGVLLREGIALHGFVDVPLDHPAFEAVQQLACEGVPLGTEADLLFRPEEAMTPEAWRNWCEALDCHPATEFAGTRAEAALALYDLVAEKRMEC